MKLVALVAACVLVVGAATAALAWAVLEEDPLLVVTPPGLRVDEDDAILVVGALARAADDPDLRELEGVTKLEPGQPVLGRAGRRGRRGGPGRPDRRAGGGGQRACR
jgi:hypothetical protein